MRRTVVLIVLLFVAIPAAFTGCVSVANSANWRPQNDDVAKNYYRCLGEAQQGYATSSVGVSVSRYSAGGAATSSSGAKTNYHMLKSCMQAAGYQKRDPTKGEVITGVALLPVSAPLCILAAIGGYNCLEEE